MAKIYEIERRLLVPNWRDFKRTVLIGELGNNLIPKVRQIDNSQVRYDWTNNKTIGIAADLISTSFLLNDLNSLELNDAINFVENNLGDASNPLIALVNNIKREKVPKLEERKKVLEKDFQSLEEFNSLANIELFNKIIAKTKKLTKDYNFNAIYWVELARLYTIKNQIEKAEKCILIALNLAPNNRFVLRSAVRYFIHTENYEKALFYLRKSSSIKFDPWLISAHIATSKLIDRFSPFIKDGLSLVKSNQFSNFDLTELASTIGTLELESGSFRKSKPFIELSLASPNDNSLAQFEWLTKKESRYFLSPQLFDKVVNPFEALAYENFHSGKFKESFFNCTDWYLDFPYSKRPLMFGSYIASLLDDFNASIILCKIGLKLDRSEVGFINNIIYAYCLSNNLSEAKIHLSKLNVQSFENFSNEEIIMIQATVGLFYIRSGQVEEGKTLYKLSMENSKKSNSDFQYNLALINLTRELFLIKDIEFEQFSSDFHNITSRDKDIVLQKDKVLRLIQEEGKTGKDVIEQ